MEIRLLTEKDAAPYSCLRLEALESEPQAFTEDSAEHAATSHATIADRLKACSPGGSFVLGAFEEGKLVGMAGFTRLRGIKTSHRGYIWGVYLKRDFRIKGTGRALLTELVRLARAQPGLEQISLAVGSDNTAAKRLYRCLGFDVYGREPHTLKLRDTYIDEDLMVLRLHR
jgi:ribosomal protein S18 acetylase RimI-like enzyme